ncbi:PepSY domain-containing protein, partial [Pseudomonas sp. FW305-130]
ILAILIIPLSLTGAALVWDDALDHALNPQRYATSGNGTLAPQRYIAAARVVLQPGDAIASLTLPDAPGEPVVVSASPASSRQGVQGPPARITVWIDPASAHVLDVANNSGGLIRTLHMIHG